MSDPQNRPDSIWKDAEALIERVEQSSRGNAAASTFYDDLTSGLRLTTRASSVSLSMFDGDHSLLLSRSGVTLHSETSPLEGVAVDFREGFLSVDDVKDAGAFAAQSCWVECESGARLLARERLQTTQSLQLELCFEDAVELASRQPLSELSEVLLDLTSPVVMREELTVLRGRFDARTDRDVMIRKLNEGVGLTDSFASIATTVASETGLDRVSLLQSRGSHFRLITSSTQQKVERRARQVRLLERLVEIVLLENDRFIFKVGTPVELDPLLSDALESYCHQSGCREIYIQSISDGEGSIAAFVLEQFHGSIETHDSPEAKIATLQDPLEEAIRGAVRREDAGWGFLASRMTSQKNRRTFAFIVGVIAAIALAACFIPIELKLSADGRIVATEQSRLFAPEEGIVADIPVQNGQAVEVGERLITLRSPRLELERRAVEGTLATARTRLASLAAMRGRSNAGASRERETTVAADEQVIRTEIEGLEAQLALLKQQQADLNVVSPIDGIVDRWDMQQSLQSRPVTHGQYLVDVIAANAGWTVELEIPEKNVNYVLERQRFTACLCTFRLRSDPTVMFKGTVQEIADVAHLDATGQSMVRATFEMGKENAGDWRAGATVVAQIHCGKYPLGYVGLRSLIEWYRSNRWF